MDVSVSYANDLSNLNEGYALWIPEPHMSGEVRIGDVGFVNKRGAFMRLLNVREQHPQYEEYKVTWWPRLATDMEQLQESRVRIDKTLNPLAPKRKYLSRGVEESSVEASVAGQTPAGVGADLSATYKCHKEHGAILDLDDSAAREELVDTQYLTDYVLKNHPSWVSFAKRPYEEGGLELRDFEDSDIVFIRGFTKTTSTWEAITFGNSYSEHAVGASVDAGASASAKLMFTKKQSKTPPVLVRQGAARIQRSKQRGKDKKKRRRGNAKAAKPPQEDSPEAEETLRADQTLFIQRYMVKKNWLGRFTIRAAAGYDRLPEQRDGRSGVGGEGLRAENFGTEEDEGDHEDPRQLRSSVDPLEILLDYILEASGAQVAIASDDDVKNVLLGRDWPDDLATTLRHLRPKVDVHDDKAKLSFPDKIRREQEHRLSEQRVLPSDHRKFPAMEAGTLENGRVTLGPSSSSSRTTDWLHLKFAHKDPEVGVITSIALSPDSELLAAAWDSNAVTIWRLRDGLTVRHLEEGGHTDTVWSIAFSPDSKHIVSGSADSNAIVWEVRSGKVVSYLCGHSAAVVAVAYSPDGTLIATSSADRTVKVWDASHAATLHTFTLDSDIRHILFSPDGSRLAACWDIAATIWNPRDGMQVVTLKGHSSAVWCMAFSSDGNRVITGSQDTTARIWDASSGSALVILHEHTGSVRSVAFLPDGAEVATASYDGTIVLCDSWTGEQLRKVGDEEFSLVGEAMAYSLNNDLIASGGADGNVRVWSRESGALVADFQGHEASIANVAFTPNGRDLVSWADDCTIRSWSVCDTLRLVCLT